MCKEDKLIINTDNFNSQKEIFDTAGQLAINLSKKMGLPITSLKGDKVIKEYSDGRKETLSDVPPRVIVKENVLVFI